MKLALSLIAGSVIVAVVFCLWLNWANDQEQKEHEKKHKKIIKPLMPNWSLRNAMIVNHETCVCPDNIRFSNGIMHRISDDNLTKERSAINNREELTDMWEQEMEKKLP